MSGVNGEATVFAPRMHATIGKIVAFNRIHETKNSVDIYSQSNKVYNER